MLPSVAHLVMSFFFVIDFQSIMLCCTIPPKQKANKSCINYENNVKKQKNTNIYKLKHTFLTGLTSVIIQSKPNKPCINMYQQVTRIFKLTHTQHSSTVHIFQQWRPYMDIYGFLYAAFYCQPD